MLGVIAALALCIYALYFYALVKLIPITLTLPGIAGLILTLGVAADANIVVFERVKEEVRAGRSVGTAIVTGYRKGLTAIIDANIVTFLVAFILFIIATAGVQGFAFTLGLGVIVSLFTAVLATQAILYSLRGTRLIALQGGAGRRRAAVQVHDRLHGQGEVVLLAVRAASCSSARWRCPARASTSASTSTAARASPRALEKAATVDQVRDALAPLGLADAKIQTLDEPRARQARRPDLDQGARRRAASTRSTSALEHAFGSGGPARTSRRSARASAQTVASSAVYAIIASLLIISIYIALRFEWKFAVPVLIALMHDILIVAGVYALVGREVTTSTVAALLTILGYSLYDTIIVFDRVRENIPRMPSAAFSQIVNRSLSEVIVRSLATSFCTLLPVLALMLFGGETLRDFAFALLIGIASGTYSSIFIATPVLQHWKEREPGFRARHARILERLGSVPAVRDGRPGRPDRRPAQGARRAAASRAPPGQEVSATEFQEMVTRPRRRRGEQPQPAASPRPRPRGRPAGGRRARARAERRHRRRRRAPSPPTPATAATATREGTKAAQPASREATLMALLVWTMVGLALWHFTVFLPDNFYGGIVGAFCGALLGSIIFGMIVNLGSIPGESDTDLLTGVEAVPGALLGMGLMWWLGVRQIARSGTAPLPSH